MTAASYDAKYLTPGGIAQNFVAEAEAAQAVRWNAMADFYANQAVAAAASYDAKYLAPGGIAQNIVDESIAESVLSESISTSSVFELMVREESELQQAIAAAIAAIPALR